MQNLQDSYCILFSFKSTGLLLIFSSKIWQASWHFALCSKIHIYDWIPRFNPCFLYHGNIGLYDYCDVFVNCLDFHSDGTHLLQRIHWWASDTKFLKFCSNEETNSSTSCIANFKLFLFKLKHYIKSRYSLIHKPSRLNNLQFSSRSVKRIRGRAASLDILIMCKAKAVTRFTQSIDKAKNTATQQLSAESVWYGPAEIYTHSLLKFIAV